MNNKLSNSILLLFLLLAYHAKCQMNWPLPSFTSQHQITGTTGEFRQNGSNARFHLGIDMVNGTNYNVYAIEAGTASYNPNGSNSSITVTNGNGSILYIHTNSLISNGQSVSAGQLIGTMYTQSAIHLHLQNINYNFLSTRLYPYTDNIAPTVYSINFRQNGYSYLNVTPTFSQQIAINSLNHTIVYNKVDIEAKAQGPGILSNGNASGSTVAPYSVSYEVLDNNNISVDGTPVENIKFEQIPNNSAGNYVMGNGSQLGPTSFYYILTSHPRITPYDRYWNTALRNGITETWPNTNALDARSNDEAKYADGQYTLPVVAKDVAYLSNPALTATQVARLLIDNFRPYIKTVQMTSGNSVYNAGWTWNSSSGQLVFSSNVLSGIAGGANNLDVTINTSEPMQNVTLNISTLAYSNTSAVPIANTDRKQWQFTIPAATISAASSCSHILSISGNDLAGNPLQANPSIIPKRQLNGTWNPAPVPGNDTYHSFTTGTGLSLSFNSTNASSPNFNNGNATVTVNGGQTPYSYLWSNAQTAQTISNLVPATYTVTVTSATGCSAIGSVTVLNNSSPVYCSGTTTLTAPTGFFSDGSGNNSYGNNSDCSWLIQPANAASVTLTFSAFDTEIANDEVIVYDGTTTAAPVLGTFSGNSIPSALTSSGSAILVKFLSNSTVVNAGWNASYSSIINPTTCNTPTSLNALNITAVSAILDWSTVYNTYYFKFRYRQLGQSAWIGNTSSIASYMISGLTPCRSYEYQICSFCSATDSSGYTLSEYFQTSGCPDSTNDGATNIVAYQYWFDNNYVANNFVSSPQQNVFDLDDSLDVSGLSDGMHILNIRFVDDNDKWSSVLSSFFVKYPSGNNTSKQIVEYEYWYDTDYGSKISQTVSPQQTLDLSAPLNMASLSDGMHIFNIRFKDNGDFWSSVLSQFVIKYPSGSNTNKHITEYEYWFDSNYANKVNQAVTPQISSIVNTGLDVASLTHGMHILNIRFKDDGDFWSSVLSSFFIRNGTGVANVNKITAYRYWFDTAYTSITNVLLPTPVNPYDLVTNVNTASLSAGTHTVHFQFKDSINLWSGVTNDTFNNVVGPHANFIANDTTLCYSGAVTFTNLSTNATSYQWSFGDGATATTINPTHTYTSSGLYTVRLIAIGSGNLRDTLTLINHIRVTVPNVTVSSNITICPGGSTMLLASGGTSYLWYPSTGLNTTSGVSVTASPAANTIYYVIGTDQYGCLDTAQSTVSISNIVTVSINPPATTICSGNSATLIASGADTYTWSPSTGLNAVNGATVSASPGATITYIVTGNSSCGSDTESITVNVNQTPIANAGNDTSICEGSMVNLLANGGLAYLWNNGQTTALNPVSPGSQTTYIVTVTSNNCSATDTVSVAVNPLPLVALTDTSICIGSSILLDAGSAGSTYTWQDGATTQTYAVSSGGTYSVTVTNSYGCNETDSAVVIANSTLNVQISDTSICQGQSIILNAGFPGASYTWSTNATSQTITILTANTYSVTVTHPSGCTGTDAAVVTVNANPTASAGNDVSICNGEHITLTAMGGITYSWNNAANTSINNVSPTSSTTYYVTITDNNSCSATDSVAVIVNQLPTVSLDTISTVCVNAGLMPLTGGLPAGGVYAGVGVSGGNFNPTTAGIGSHLVTYTYTDANGCHDSAQITVTVNNCTGLQNNEEQSNISLFPNPTAGLVSIAIVDVGNTQLTIKISNALGQELNSDTYPVTNSFFTKYDMSLFASGIYYVKIMVNGKLKVFNVVLEK